MDEEEGCIGLATFAAPEPGVVHSSAAHSGSLSVPRLHQSARPLLLCISCSLRYLGGGSGGGVRGQIRGDEGGVDDGSIGPFCILKQAELFTTLL